MGLRRPGTIGRSACAGSIGLGGRVGRQLAEADPEGSDEIVVGSITDSVVSVVDRDTLSIVVL